MSEPATDLFSAGPSLAPPAPLAELLRPATLDEVIGQSHLIGPGKASRCVWRSNPACHIR